MIAPNLPPLQLKTIYIHLSGNAAGRISPKETDDYYCAGPKHLGVHEHAKCIPWDVQNQRYRDIRRTTSEAVEHYYDQLGGTWNREEQTFVGNFVNDYVSYSLAPFISLLTAVTAIIDDHQGERIVVVYQKTWESQPPLFGFSTKENPRGVSELIESRVGAYLRDSGMHSHVEFVEIGLGLALSDAFRRIAFQAIGGLLVFRNIIRLISFDGSVRASRSESRTANDSRLLVIVRNEKQADYFEGLVNEGLEAKALYLPQLMLRSQSIKKEMLPYYEHGGGIFSTVRGSISFLYRWFLNRLVAYSIRYRGPELITVEGTAGSFKLRGDYFYRECRVCDAFYFETIALERYLRTKNTTEAVLTLEMEGTRAAYINSTARLAGATTVTVQTVQAASLTQPLFPMSDWFFVRSERDLTSIPANKGIRKLGKVAYEGEAFDISPLKIPETFKRVLFISQPKGHQALEPVLASLGHWANEHKAAVGIRLHPRDLSSSFSNVLAAFPGSISIRDRGESLQSAFAWSDLVIVYTSSVGMEALAHGRPVVSCIWDSEESCDRMARDGYVCAGDETQLKTYLFEPAGLEKMLDEGRSEMFGSKKRKDLVAYINNLSTQRQSGQAAAQPMPERPGP